MKEIHYTENDCLSVTELKAMPIGSHISGCDTYYYAIKTDVDEWTFDDRIETMFGKSSRFIESVFEYTEFDVYIKED